MSHLSQSRFLLSPPPKWPDSASGGSSKSNYGRSSNPDEVLSQWDGSSHKTTAKVPDALSEVLKQVFDSSDECIEHFCINKLTTIQCIAEFGNTDLLNLLTSFPVYMLGNLKS